ncbi:MAG: PKD domain-containing protein [Solirubrobacteraceae bacterium]
MARAIALTALVAIVATAVTAAVGTLATAARAAARRTPTLAPSDVIVDGPSSAIVSLDGMAIARDGTGGLIYLKDAGGAAHVFVSRLLNGGFQTPVQVDAGLAGPSSQPVIAADDGGVLLVAFINGGQLYAASWAGSAMALTAPTALYAGAANPSISLSTFGKAYLAFTAPNGSGGGHVMVAFQWVGQTPWAVVPTPLDNDPAADDAGVGDGRPQVATAGDGDGIVVWGEGGHIYTRRVVKTTASVVDEQADPSSFDGWQEVSAGDPAIATGGDSSYASVAFEEMLSSAGVDQSRVIDNRLHGSQYDGPQQADGAVTGGPEGADQPATAVTEFGDGWVTSELDQSHELFATTLGDNESAQGTLRVDSLPNSTASDAVPATAGLTSTLIAWQQSPGVAGLPEIRIRYAADGHELDPEEVISNPALGPTEAALGLFAGGDTSGDAAVAWVQGAGAAAQIVTAQLYNPPGGFVPAQSFSYATTADPTLSWSAASELWGSPQYVVTIDGVQVGQTTALSFTPPTPLANGGHVYQVTAVNQSGLSTAAPAATVFVDTVAPVVTFTISGTRAIGSRLHLVVKATDAPSGVVTPAQSSGIATIVVGFGDGSSYTITRGRSTSAIILRTSHAYRRARFYTVKVTVTDHAGNVTTVTKRIKIAAKAPTPKHRPKPARHKAPRSARR